MISRSGSNRSMAPMSPSSPYDARSCSSTCDGRLAPSRLATNLTSGAYVRIRRSRSTRFVSTSDVARYVRQSDAVSPPDGFTATRKEYAVIVLSHSCSSQQNPPCAVSHPERQCGRRERDHPRATARDRRPHRDQPERHGDHCEQSSESPTLHRLSVPTPARLRCPPNRAATLRPQPRGVAQLVAHRSPKPGVAGSSPVAPVFRFARFAASPLCFPLAFPLRPLRGFAAVLSARLAGAVRRADQPGKRPSR